ncbi:1-acyl-sn-glycerol-3-phosphate acyltransferase alpha-like [Culicoides brevitarsis]|uniref:1-acyl-sn-glycerol-3-phosphate acyltransferase alpha-like n=1 Tax=Culicoides brevitarsis TaxID=469753 RepID=UPI00307C1D5E
MLSLNSYYELLVVILILSLIFLYDKSSVFRYYSKYFIYYTYISVEAVFMIPVFMLKARNVSNLVLASQLSKQVTSIIRVNWEIRGAEILSQDKPFVIVANHQSSIDVLGMFQIWHIMKKCTVVARKELLYVFPVGLASWLCGLVFIDRKNAQKAKEKINEVGDYLKEKNIKLWFYPEGTRRNTREIHEFKKGAFHFAVSQQLPILPVVISSYSSFLDDKNKRFDQGNVIITALPPISTRGLEKSDIEDLMERTRNTMIKTYIDTSNEIDAKRKLSDLS